MVARLVTSLEAVWHRLKAWPALSCASFGLIAALGYPPLHAWWVAIPAFAGFVALLYEAPTARSAAWRGWLFGWAHLTLANNWIATAFTHQAQMSEYLGWVAVPLLCVYLAVYPAMASTLANVLARRTGPLAFAAVFAGAWILFEWARSWVFTGYPWPPLGLLALGDWDTAGLAALLPWTGTYALSGLVVLIAGLIAAFVRSAQWLSAVFMVGLTALVMLVPMHGERSDSTEIAFTLVQPYIPQDEINDGSKFEEQFLRIARLTAKGNDRSRVVLWPESAVPDYLEPDYPQRYYNQTTAVNPETREGDPEYARQRIGSVIGPEGTLLTGVVNLDIAEVEGQRRAVSARNSVVALNGAGELTHHYAKGHLVPYGEYLPMRSLLEPLGLSRLVAGSIEYKPGPGPRTLDLGIHGKAGVQICYEIVFSGRVVDREDRPDYLFNPSNDGWFGWWGPPQHLAQARMRALEEGLPVLRSTTTGISAVIDANGVVRQSIAMGESAARDGFIPQPHSATLFARLGNTLPLLWAAILILVGLSAPRLLALRKPQS